MEETLILSAIPKAKRQNVFKRGLNAMLTFTAAPAILFIYLVLPLAQLFDFIQDWIAQLLAAACVMMLVEGAVGLVLLSIARSIALRPIGHPMSTMSTESAIERQPTARLAITTLDEAPTIIMAIPTLVRVDDTPTLPISVVD